MNLATIQRVEEIKPIENAEFLEHVRILGWWCVCVKDQYRIGDLVCYIQIDTVCPETKDFEFLRDKKFRVKTIKLRGAISQGLIVPLTILHNSKSTLVTEYDYYEGADITDLLGIKKYEKPDTNPIERYEKPRRPKTWFARFKYDLKYNYLYKWFPKLRPKQRSKFPTNLVSITDEERIQNMPKVLETYKGKHFVASYKLDGSSITIIHQKSFGKSKYRICSRRFELHDKKNDWYRVFESTGFKIYIDLLVSLLETNDIIVQGEAIGRFNGNHHNLKQDEIRLFNIYVNGKRMPQDEFLITCDYLGIPHCPKYWEGELNFTLPEILKFAQIKDIINPKVDAEGLVFRSIDDNLSFKVISNSYLLKEK